MSAQSVELRGAAEFSGQMKAAPVELSKAQVRALKRGGQIIGKFWKLRLSGPAGARKLGIGTGDLRRSITVGNVEAGGIIRVGTSKPYAAIHEFGFRGAVAVSAHMRRLKNGTTFPVRAHTRQMNMPQRPHRAPAVRDARRPIDLIFGGEVDKGIAESKRIGNRLKFQQRAQLGDLKRQGLTGRRTR